MARAVTMPVKVDPAAYVDMFEGRMPAPPALSGVCGRVVRGRSEADFGMLSFASGRRLAWVMGPDGLRDLIGRSAESIVLGVGKDRAWLREKLAEDMRWRLVVLPQAECVRADWDGVFAMVEAHYPEVAGKLSRWRGTLEDPRLVAGIDPTLVAGIVKDDAAHPRHVSVERYLVGEDTAESARLFLWHSLGLNGSFVGDGWAINPETNRRVEEHLTGNVELASVPGHRHVSLHVRPG